MSRFSRTVSSVSRVSCWGTTPSRARICGPSRAGVQARGCVSVPARDRRDAADHPHRRGLAGAVRAEEAERFARRDVEVDGVDGGEVAEPLGQAAGMDERGGRRGRRHGRASYRATGRVATGGVRYRRRAVAVMAPKHVLRCGSTPMTCYSSRDRTPRARSHPMATMPDPVARAARAQRSSASSPSSTRTADPVTYPLIPLWDGEHVYMTSSTLFSRKLEHIEANPKVVGVDHRPGRGRRADRSRHDPGRRPGHRRRPARRLGAPAADLGGEGAVDRLVPQGAGRAAALLRARAHRDHAAAGPVLAGRRRAARAERHDRRRRRPRDALDPRDRRPAGLDEARRPIPTRSRPGSTTTAIPSASPSRRRSTRPPRPRRSRAPAGLAVPTDRDVSLTGSHIRPQPGYGYDERRHVTVWGRAQPASDGRHAPTAARAWGWDEAEVPFFEYSERSLAAVAPVLRRAVGRARDAGQAAAVVRVPRPCGRPACRS